MRTWIAIFAPVLLVVIAATPLVAQPPAQPAKPAALDAVPTDSFAFLTVNAGKLWDNPSFAPLREWFTAQKIGPTDEVFGVPPAARFFAAFGDGSVRMLKPSKLGEKTLRALITPQGGEVVTLP